MKEEKVKEPKTNVQLCEVVFGRAARGLDHVMGGNILLKQGQAKY